MYFEQARVGRLAVIDSVRPVSVARVASAAFVLGELDVAAGKAASEFV